MGAAAVAEEEGGERGHRAAHAATAATHVRGRAGDRVEVALAQLLALPRRGL